MVEAHKVFHPRLSISLQTVFQFIIDNYSYSYRDFERIYNVFEDTNTHDVVLSSGDRNSKYVTDNYDPEIINIARNVFRKIVYDSLEIEDDPDTSNDIVLEFYCSSDREFLRLTHLYCVCALSFLTKESFNKFKITNQKMYHHLIDFEKDMEAYRKMCEGKDKEYYGKKRL